MQHIVYYISSHGFGHLTRSLAIIELLLQEREDLTICIKCSAEHAAFAERYLRERKLSAEIQLFASNFEIVVDPVKVQVNFPATIHNLRKWIKELPERAVQECEQISRQTTVIISDIVPEAFLAAEQLGIPAIGISNFTWYEICKDYVEEDELLILRELYQKAAAFLEYPLSTGDNMPVANRTAVGLISRPIETDKVDEIRRRYKKSGRPLLLFSIGGALELEYKALPAGIDWLHTRGVSLPPAQNIFSIPDDEPDIQNYVAACDAVVTKFGWSTLAEALIAEKPVFLLKANGGWAEENMIMPEIEALACICSIAPAELYAFSPEVLEQQLEEMRRSYKRLGTRYQYSAGEILKQLTTFFPAGY